MNREDKKLLERIIVTIIATAILVCFLIDVFTAT